MISNIDQRSGPRVEINFKICYWLYIIFATALRAVSFLGTSHPLTIYLVIVDANKEFDEI